MFSFLLKKFLKISLHCSEKGLFLTFYIHNSEVESVKASGEYLLLNEKHKLVDRSALALYKYVIKNKTSFTDGRVYFNREALPEVLSRVYQLRLKYEVVGLCNEYKIVDTEKFNTGIDYAADFIADKGYVKSPTLIVSKRSSNIYSLDEKIVAVVPKGQLDFYFDYWIGIATNKQFLRLPDETYKKLEEAKQIQLSAKDSYDFFKSQSYYSYYGRPRYYSDYNQRQTNPNLKKVSVEYLLPIPIFKFENGKLFAEIRFTTSPYAYHAEELQLTEIKVSDRQPDVFVRGFTIFNAFERNMHIKRIMTELREMGFVTRSQSSIYTKDPDLIFKLIKKLQKQKSIHGMQFVIHDSAKSLTITEDTIEPIVSVRLDEGRGLIYLDADYYLKTLKVDRGRIKRALQEKSSMLNIDNRLIRLDLKKIKALSTKLEEKRVLPLDKFYEALQIARLAKRAEYSQSYKRFFEDLQELKRLPERELPTKYLRKNVDVLRHQVVGYQWLSFLAAKGLNGILADEMGVGKTLQSLLAVFASKDFTSKVNVIVCPKSLVENWRNEIEKFFNFDRVIIHYGGDRLKKFNTKIWRGSIVITTYDILRSDFQKFSGLDINYLIADEAQKIKNPKTRTAKTLKIVNAKHRIALSGTPIENRLSDLWSIFDFLMHGFWGSQREFRKRFEIPIVRHDDKKALAELHSISRPLILRRLSKDVFRLPPLIFGTKSCDLYNEQFYLYKKLIDDPRTKTMVKKIKQDELLPTSMQILALLQKLRMVCSHPDLITKEGKDGKRSGKMELLFRILKDLVADKKNRILVFIEFRQNFAFIEHWLDQQKISFTLMHGMTGAAERTKRIKDFNDGKVQVFLVGLKVGGLGLNLTKANYVLLFDRWWNPAVESQAVKRAHRPGQKKKVTAYRFITKGTIEERLEELHKKKRELFKGVLETERIYEKLSKKDILRLLEIPGEKAKINK